MTITIATDNGTLSYRRMSQADINRLITIYSEMLDAPYAVKRVIVKVSE